MNNNDDEMPDPMELMTSGHGIDKYVPEAETRAVSRGEVSDVAYLAWESSGNFDAEYIVEESSKDSTAVEPVSRAAAEEALEALSDYGLVRNRDEDMEELGDELDIDRRGPRYEAGSSQELKDPLSMYGGLNIIDPEEAFEMIGRMQQTYEFMSESPDQNRGPEDVTSLHASSSPRKELESEPGSNRNVEEDPVSTEPDLGSELYESDDSGFPEEFLEDEEEF